MSTTIKQAIEALKTRIAGAYAAVSEKGGTLPATQDSANLPAAIASIPSGGGDLQFPATDFFSKVKIWGSGSQFSTFILNNTVCVSEELSFDNLVTIYAGYAMLNIGFTGLKRLRFPVLRENISTSFGFFITYPRSLEYIYIGSNGRGNSLRTLFEGGNNLSRISDIEFGQGFGHTISINDTTNTAIITRQTIVDHMLNRLYDFSADPLPGFTPTLYLGAWLDRLTSADIAIATNKGWTLA